MRRLGAPGELRANVEALAERIAAFPAQGGSRRSKARVNVQKPSEADLAGDNELFTRLAQAALTQAAADRFVVLLGDEGAGGG